MNIFVTGGTGFLGYNTVLRLLEDEHQVYALVRKQDNVLSQIKNKNLSLIHGSLENLACVELPDIDVCVHFAWMGVNRQGVNSPDIQQQNVINTLNLLEFLKTHHCRLLIDAGSRQEYTPADGIISEASPCVPITEYGRRKLEVYHAILSKLNDEMKYIHLRIFSIYGNGDHPWSLINTCVEGMLDNKSIKLGMCRHFWSFLYIDDFTSIISAIVSHINEIRSNTIYNVASGFIQPLRYFVNSMKVITKSDSELQFGTFEENKESVFSLIPDVSKLNIDFSWHETVSFEEGIKRIIRYKFDYSTRSKPIYFTQV